MTLRSGQITVATAGTAVAGPVSPKGNRFALKGLTANTGVVWVGNDGAGDVAAGNGFPLSPGEKIIIDTSIASLQRVGLLGVYFDADNDGDIISWMELGSPRVSLGNYAQKVLGIAPSGLIAYWTLTETDNLVAVNLEGTAARNGDYSAAMKLANAPGPDGVLVSLFDGANDVVDIYSASLNTAFDGDEGSVGIWAKVSGAGVWADSTLRYILRLSVDASNGIFVARNSVDDELVFQYSAGGTDEDLTPDIGSPTDWFHIGITWSALADEVIFYINGIQEGLTATTLGTFAGVLLSTGTVIGSGATTPANVFDGHLAHPVIWDTPLTPAQMLEVGTA